MKDNFLFLNKKLLYNRTFFKDLFHLFFPKICANCSQQLVENETLICTICRHDLPFTNITNYKENKIVDSFYGKLIIHKAFALLFYRKASVTKNLIQELKYKGNEEISTFFGNWLGELLKGNNEFSDVNYIIPVPLHKKKLKQRGYNQVTKFGERLSYHLKIPFLENKLVRISSTKTQTLKSRFDRFTNLDTKFELKDVKKFNQKHVLIIDDVITTGATLEACAKEFTKASNCKISILTIAYTE